MGKYARRKQDLLSQFGIALSNEEQKHIQSLHSEIAVDNYCRKLILEQLDKLCG